MIDPASFRHVELRGGFIITDITLTPEPMIDALDREALAQTRIIGREFRILIRADLSQEELSISLYHEILEAATVASDHPPTEVVDFNEGDFEREARAINSRFGEASPENLNRMFNSSDFERHSCRG